MWCVCRLSPRFYVLVTLTASGELLVLDRVFALPCKYPSALSPHRLSFNAHPFSRTCIMQGPAGTRTQVLTHSGFGAGGLPGRLAMGDQSWSGVVTFRDQDWAAGSNISPPLPSSPYNAGPMHLNMPDHTIPTAGPGSPVSPLASTAIFSFCGAATSCLAPIRDCHWPLGFTADHHYHPGLSTTWHNIAVPRGKAGKSFDQSWLGV